MHHVITCCGKRRLASPSSGGADVAARVERVGGGRGMLLRHGCPRKGLRGRRARTPVTRLQRIWWVTPRSRVTLRLTSRHDSALTSMAVRLDVLRRDQAGDIRSLFRSLTILRARRALPCACRRSRTIDFLLVIPVSLDATSQRTSDTRQFYGRESNEQSLDEVAVVRRDVPEVETTQFWVDAGTARLFVSAGGVGEPILLLHGGMASHAAVEPLARHWREQFQVITPDLRSNGASHYGGSISFDLLSTDLGLVLDALQLNHAIVAGVSSGAAVALAFALRAPHRSSRLILITPSHAGSAAGLSEPQRAAFNRLLAAAER